MIVLTGTMITTITLMMNRLEVRPRRLREEHVNPVMSKMDEEINKRCGFFDDLELYDHEEEEVVTISKNRERLERMIEVYEETGELLFYDPDKV